MKIVRSTENDEVFPEEAHTREHVLRRLRGHVEMRHKHDTGEKPLQTVTRSDLTNFIDEWLATLVELDELTCTGPGCKLCAKETERAD